MPCYFKDGTVASTTDPDYCMEIGGTWSLEPTGVDNLIEPVMDREVVTDSLMESGTLENMTNMISDDSNDLEKLSMTTKDGATVTISNQRGKKDSGKSNLLEPSMPTFSGSQIGGAGKSPSSVHPVISNFINGNTGRELDMTQPPPGVTFDPATGEAIASENELPSLSEEDVLAQEVLNLSGQTAGAVSDEDMNNFLQSQLGSAEEENPLLVPPNVLEEENPLLIPPNVIDGFDEQLSQEGFSEEESIEGAPTENEYFSTVIPTEEQAVEALSEVISEDPESDEVVMNAVEAIDELGKEVEEDPSTLDKVKDKAGDLLNGLGELLDVEGKDIIRALVLYAGARLFGSSPAGAAQFAWEDFQTKMIANLEVGKDARAVIGNREELMMAYEKHRALAEQASLDGDETEATRQMAEADAYLKAANELLDSDSDDTAEITNTKYKHGELERLDEAIADVEDKLKDDPEDSDLLRALKTLEDKRQIVTGSGMDLEDRLALKDKDLDNKLEVEDTKFNYALVEDNHSTVNNLIEKSDGKINNYLEEKMAETEGSMEMAARGDQMIRIIEEEEVVTGIFSDYAGKFNRLLVSMGFDEAESKATSYDALQSFQYTFVREQMEATKGSITVVEMQMFFDASPNLNKTIGGLKLMIGTLSALSEANVKRNNFLNEWFIGCTEVRDDYRSTSSDKPSCSLAEKNRAMAEYDKENPMRDILPSNQEVKAAEQSAKNVERDLQDVHLQTAMEGDNLETLTEYYFKHSKGMSLAAARAFRNKIEQLKSGG